MQIRLKVWRQESMAKQGKFVDYALPEVSPDMSFLEMLVEIARALVSC
jgi:succinate dehydrogenase iron-sulfur subunit